MTETIDTIEEAKKRALAESRERLGSMCGYCAFWHRIQEERCRGKRVGLCSVTGLVMDRCAWCVAEEERKNAAAEDHCG